MTETEIRTNSYLDALGICVSNHSDNKLQLHNRNGEVIGHGLLSLASFCDFMNESELS